MPSTFASATQSEGGAVAERADKIRQHIRNMLRRLNSLRGESEKSTSA